MKPPSPQASPEHLKSGATSSSEQVLQQLLEGTGLKYQFLDSRTIAVSPIREDSANARPVSTLRLAQAEQSASDAGRSAAAAAQGTRGSASEGVALEEIVVTAQKREQRLQDVPLSIAVADAEDIDRRGLINAEDYLRGMPGVNQVDTALNQTIVIRGIESATTFQNFGSGPTTATYFGETPTTNAAGLFGGTNVDLKLVDIERVEVLRGPQGTAFGNSSLGGAVRTIPVAPKLDRFEGQVAAATRDVRWRRRQLQVQAVGNFPLIQDRLAIRATATSTRTVATTEPRGLRFRIPGGSRLIWSSRLSHRRRRSR